VFITVNAGQSTAQFQMESLAAIVPGPAPKHERPKTPSAPRGWQFGAPTTASQSVPEMLFAVPQGDPGNEPAVDSPASACPESPADDACSDRAAAPSSSPGNEVYVSLTDPKSKLAEGKAPKKPRVQAEKDRVPPIAASPVHFAANPASSTRPPADKRSCRVLAEDGIMFY